MWEKIDPSRGEKQLVHRCFIDSEDPKNHGCVTRAHEHAIGCVGFIEQYMADELHDAYTEESFLENLGMFLGITSHHIADICTPVHVGHKMDYRRAGSPSASKFHARFERQMARLARGATVQLHKPVRVEMNRKYFWNIARSTYEDLFLRLEDIYAKNDQAGLQEVTSEAITRSIRYTADVWHTVMLDSGICNRKWSGRPLV